MLWLSLKDYIEGTIIAAFPALKLRQIHELP